MDFYLKIAIIFVCLIVTLILLFRYFKQREHEFPVSRGNKIKLFLSSFVANVADTVGMGSFAILIAFDKTWNLVDDKKLPGTFNTHAVLPALTQSLIFLQAVKVETITLVSLIVTSSLGGLAGGLYVSNLNREYVKKLMFWGYIGMAMILLCKQLNFMPVGGELMELRGTKLYIASISMFFIGSLPCIGVGSYVPTQILLFLLGMHPLAAFPIMAASSCFVLSIASLAFIKNDALEYTPSIILSVAAVIGVLLIAPFVASFNPYSLRWVLFAVVLYNVYMLRASGPTTVHEP